MLVHKSKKGFTLIELLIVISVIAIIIGIALPRFRGIQDEGKIIQAKAELRTLQTAVESFYIHNNNTYPANLTALITATPLVVSAIPNDPYNGATAYTYVRGGVGNQTYVIYSRGPSQNGTAAINGTTSAVTETNGASCIVVSNNFEDTAP